MPLSNRPESVSKHRALCFVDETKPLLGKLIYTLNTQIACPGAACFSMAREILMRRHVRHLVRQQMTNGSCYGNRRSISSRLAVSYSRQGCSTVNQAAACVSTMTTLNCSQGLAFVNRPTSTPCRSYQFEASNSSRAFFRRAPAYKENSSRKHSKCRSPGVVHSPTLCLNCLNSVQLKRVCYCRPSTLRLGGQGSEQQHWTAAHLWSHDRG